MESASFEVVFLGAAVEGGRIRAKDLAVSFIAMNDLFELANDEVGGVGGKASLEVKALNAGSFEVVFDLVRGSSDLLGVLPPQYLDDLLAIVGISGQHDAWMGLLQLIKWLKGRKLRKDLKVEVKEETVNIVEGDQTNVTIIDKRTLSLADNPNARRAADKFTSPLDEEGIDEMKIKRDGEEILQIDEGIRDYYRAPRGKEIDEIEREKKVVVVLNRISFKASQKWYVTIAGDEVERPVGILDEEFIGRVADRRITFGRGDKMEVILREIEFVEGAETKLKRDILKVLSHIPGAKQSELDL